MSQTHLGKAVRCLIAVLLVAHSFALFACGGGENQVRNFNATPVTCTGPSSTSAGNITSVTGQALTFSPANSFDPRIPASVASVTLTFTAATTFSQLSSNGSASGNVGAFGANGAVTLTYTASTYPAGQGPQATAPNNTLAFTACSIQVTASGVEVGGDRVTGTATVTLTRGSVVIQSQGFTVQIRIAPDGTLIIVNPITGTEDVTNVNVLATGVSGVSVSS